MKQKKNASMPAYMKIAAILREQIFDGTLVPGDILPSESFLCEQHQVSRDTIRKSLGQLEHENLIYSRPKVGYFVSNPRHSEYLLDFPEDTEGYTSKFKDVHAIYPDEKLKDALQIDGTHKVIEMSQIIYGGETPVAWDVKYIPYSRAYPSVETEMNYAVFPGPVSMKVATYDYYRELAISAVTADEKIAGLLLCQTGDPVLLVQRVYIKRDGQRLSYALRYLAQSDQYGSLTGVSDFRSRKYFNDKP